MKSSVNRKLAAGIVGTALLFGAGGAVAATQISGGTSRQAYLNDVAKHLNVPPSTLVGALRAASDDRVNAEVAAGHLSRGQADRIERQIAKGDGFPRFLDGHRHRGRLRGFMKPVAAYLGITPAVLRTDLRSGKSLAQIASATPGRSVAGLKSAIVAADRTRLEKAVAAGRITSTQEQRRLMRLSRRLDQLVNRTWPIHIIKKTG
ncbi:MAG: hypothetical protein ACYC91_10650 [Solirubrobacteraceae bacterium]